MAIGKNLEPSDLSKRVAALIRAQMGLKDVSQADLIRGTGISQPTIHRLIKGTRAMDLEQMNLICGVLRISVATVLAEAEEHIRNMPANVTELRPRTSADDATVAEPVAARQNKGKLHNDAAGDDA